MEAHALVDRHIESFDRADVRLFAGDTGLGGLSLPPPFTPDGTFSGYPLIALPGLPAVDVAASACVGRDGDPPLDFNDMMDLARQVSDPPRTL